MTPNQYESEVQKFINIAGGNAIAKPLLYFDFKLNVRVFLCHMSTTLLCFL